jgi:hypothetical protein
MVAPSPPTTVYPVCTQLLQAAKEVGGFAVSPSSGTSYTSIPIAGFTPSPKVTWIEDTSYWGDFVKTHDLQQGPIWMESEIKESPLYGDTFPIFAFNLMGDLVTTGTAATPTWVTSSALTPGAGPIPVTSGSSAVAGTFIQVDSTAGDSECVIVGTGSTATSIVLSASTPLRFSHLTGIAITTVVAPFSHQLSLLNPYGSTGVTTGQGPTHTFVHRTNIPGSGNNYAWSFAYGVMSEISIMGKASGALTWSGKLTHLSRAYPAFVPTPSFSTVRMVPAWKGATTVASSVLNEVTQWTVTMTRTLQVTPTADGYQQPYLIGRGNLDATWKLTYDPALDETPLSHVLSNDQPTFAYAIGNGGSGSGLISFDINAAIQAYKDSPLTMDKTFFGWEASGQFIGNTTDAGNSGGRSPVQLVIQNAVPTY